MHKVELTTQELELVRDALDALAYWEVAEEIQRDDGFVTFSPDAENAPALRRILALAENISKQVGIVVDLQAGEGCESCGGNEDNPQGCRSCCRDCGFPCSEDKDDEGFHETDDEDDEEEEEDGGDLG